MHRLKTCTGHKTWEGRHFWRGSADIVIGAKSGDIWRNRIWGDKFLLEAGWLKTQVRRKGWARGWGYVGATSPSPLWASVSIAVVLCPNNCILRAFAVQFVPLNWTVSSASSPQQLCDPCIFQSFSRKTKSVQFIGWSSAGSSCLPPNNLDGTWTRICRCTLEVLVHYSCCVIAHYKSTFTYLLTYFETANDIRLTISAH